MDTEQFMKVIEDHKVLINVDDDHIVKDDSGTIWFFGYGMTASGRTMQPSEMFEDQVSIMRPIDVGGTEVLIPIFAVSTKHFEVRE